MDIAWGTPDAEGAAMAEASIQFRKPAPVRTPSPDRDAVGLVTELRVGGMDCGSCAQKVSQALLSVPSVEAAAVDVSRAHATVRWSPGATPVPERLSSAVAAAGYSAEVLTLTGASSAEVTLQIEGMDCGSCAQKVTAAVRDLKGVQSVRVELEAGRAVVRGDAATPEFREALIQAVTRAGYRATVLSADAPVGPGTEPGSTAWRTAVWLGAPVTALLMLGEWVMGWGMERWFQWMAFGLALPVQVWVGGRFYRGAWRQARVGQSNMDTLVALGSTAAFGFSVWALISGHTGHLYFMEAVAILTLVSVGHWLEARMSARAGAALRSLLDLAPARARRLTGPGPSSASEEEDVAVASLRPGDWIALRPGDRIPVDAVVMDGTSEVDEAMLTGEALPVEKAPGATVFAGTLNQSGRLAVRVTSTGDTTALAHIIAAVQRAQSSRAQIQRLADRISAVFVPVVIVVAVAAALAWGLGYSTMQALHDSLVPWLWSVHPAAGPAAAAIGVLAAVLIVACPCAMGLATPAALMAGVNAAARQGILIRDAQALEKSGRVTTVVFDKTGTLTEGRPRVVADQVWGAPAAGLPALAAALAGPSQHPLSRAVADLDTRTGAAVGEWREIRGSGVEGNLEESPEWVGGRYRLGSLNWAKSFGVDLGPGGGWLETQAVAGGTILVLFRDRQLLAGWALRDALKPGAAAVVRELQNSGLKVRLLSGDLRSTALSVAAELGLGSDQVSAEVRPEQKAEEIRRFQARGERVAFVGDGLNDGPALAQADLGIAVAKATDVAREAADLVLLRSDLAAIPVALRLAQATLRVIRQNLFWAFFYNTAAIPLAALGFLSPVLCALAMGLSDIMVLGNALRLRRWVGKVEG